MKIFDIFKSYKRLYLASYLYIDNDINIGFNINFRSKSLAIGINLIVIDFSMDFGIIGIDPKDK